MTTSSGIRIRKLSGSKPMNPAAMAYFQTVLIQRPSGEVSDRGRAGQAYIDTLWIHH
jgi:hypothetical protein